MVVPVVVVVEYNPSYGNGLPGLCGEGSSVPAVPPHTLFLDFIKGKITKREYFTKTASERSVWRYP